MHFHSGHGNSGSIMGTDTDLKVSVLKNAINVNYCIFATCLTLNDNGWYSAFGSNAKMIMGFTNVTTDASCLAMAKAFPDKIKQGQTYLKAWYLTNSVIKQHQDRWATYVKEDSKIVLYSASGKHPYIHLQGESVTIAEYVTTDSILLNEWNATYFNKRVTPAVLGKKTYSYKHYLKFPKKTTSFTFDEVKYMAIASIGDSMPDHARLDGIIPIEKCTQNNICSIIGYNIQFVQEYNNLIIRSNSSTDYISVLIGKDGVVNIDKSWTEIVPENLPVTGTFLSVGKALSAASFYISNTIKKPIYIISFSTVLGISNDYNDKIIIPAYEFIGSKGERFVVSAYTGKLLE
jgi:hypothetical protein